MQQPILIISTTVDIATDAVVLELERRQHPFLRINTDSYPYQEQATLELVGEEDIILRGRSTAPKSVWYRRLRSPERPESIEPGMHRYCLGEAQAFVRGLGHAAATRVMSPPDAIYYAENKMVQLRAARAIGLRVPASCITNDPSRARSFIASHDRTVAKALRSGWFEDTSGQWSIFTTEITPEMAASLDSVSLAPAIFQELIPKRCDIRVTIVGQEIFAAEIDSQSDDSSRIDWRRTNDPKLKHTRCTLPEDLERRLLSLMSMLRLEFGAIDLVRRPDNEYVFLEVNPNGQWLWIDDQLDMGITAAVASWLEGEE